MPSINDLQTRLVTPENAGLTVAVPFSVVAAYAIQLRGSDVVAFFGLIVLGVSTPTTLTSHDLLGERVTTAAARVSIGCAGTLIAYIGLLAIVSGLSGDFVDASVAFVLTALVVEGAARMLG